MVRVGLIARATESGLGHLSRDFCTHLRPDRVLVVTRADQRYQDHLEWYSEEAVTVPMASLDGVNLDGFMASVDVLFGYETWYSTNVVNFARSAGTRLVLMGMPELTRMPGTKGWLGPVDQYVWPTTWLLDQRPGRLLPVPVEPRTEHVEPADRLRIVHVAGAGATGDRNGTELLMTALRRVQAEVHLRLCTFGPLPPIRVPANVTVEVWRFTLDRYEMYQGCDLLVMPRRYGGLCLPALEAMSCGLAVMMTDTSPQNTDWPILPIPCVEDVPMRCAAGFVPRVTTHPSEVAVAIDAVAYDRALVNKAAEAARLWAAENSWAALSPLYREVLGTQ